MIRMSALLEEVGAIVGIEHPRTLAQRRMARERGIIRHDRLSGVACLLDQGLVADYLEQAQG
jgi:hypothetical protein